MHDRAPSRPTRARPWGANAHNLADTVSYHAAGSLSQAERTQLV